MAKDSQVASILTFATELKRLVNEINGALSARFRAVGLTGVQAEALMALDRLGPVTLKRLAEHLIAESGHPSRLVSRLVDEGFVSREVSERDGRAVTLDLTEKGREYAALAFEARAPLVREFADRFGDRVVDTTALLSEFRQALTEHNGTRAL